MKIFIIRGVILTWRAGICNWKQIDLSGCDINLTRKLMLEVWY